MSRTISALPRRGLRISGALLAVGVLILLLVWRLTPPPASFLGVPAALPPIGKRDVQIVAVQMTWKPDDFATPGAYRSRIDSLIRDGLKRTQGGARILIVFPEDIGAPLYFVNRYDSVRNATTLAGAMTSLATNHTVEVFLRSLFCRVSPARALALTRAADVGRTYVETFSSLARDHGVYIVAGSAPLPDFPIDYLAGSITYAAESNDVFNVSYFFGPDGRIIGRQRKVNLIPLEQIDGLDLTPGRLEDLSVFNTEFGSVGIAICADVFHDDVVSALVKKGADILVQPSANPDPWNRDEQENWLLSAWTAAQDHPELRCVVNPMMNGRLFDLTFEGQSSIATLASRFREDGSYLETEPCGGFLAVAARPDSEEVLCVTVPAAMETPAHAVSP